MTHPGLGGWGEDGWPSAPLTRSRVPLFRVNSFCKAGKGARPYIVIRVRVPLLHAKGRPYSAGAVRARLVESAWSISAESSRRLSPVRWMVVGNEFALASFDHLVGC
jgi:hypothetical protein